MEVFQRDDARTIVLVQPRRSLNRKPYEGCLTYLTLKGCRSIYAGGHLLGCKGPGVGVVGGCNCGLQGLYKLGQVAASGRESTRA